MIEVKNLTKVYDATGAKVVALKEINLSFNDVGFVVITGKSGSGKSTLLNILGGLDDFDKGEIRIKNISTQEFRHEDWDSFRNTYVGFVFQEFYLLENYSIGENIALALKLQGCDKADIYKRVDELLAQVDLQEIKNRKPSEISGGQKQRIAILRALIKNPAIILCDEPTGNLDSETGRQILGLLKKLAEHKLVIMVTHDLEFAKTYGDRIIELQDGVVISDMLNETTEKPEVYPGNEIYSNIIALPQGNKLSQEVIDYLNYCLTHTDKDYYLAITNVVEVQDILEKTTIDEKKEKIDIMKEAEEKFELKKTRLAFTEAIRLAIPAILHKKWRLVSMLLLFSMALTFVGIALTFSLYRATTVSYQAFQQHDIKIIPFLKLSEYCEDKCFKIADYPDEAEFNLLKKRYPHINFYQMVDTNLKANNSTPNFVWKDSDLFNHYTFNQIAFTDNYSFSLRHGNPVSGEKDIMITDYMAEVLIYHQAYDVEAIEDLVLKTITYNDETFTISGIVKTDYEKYLGLTSEDFYKSGFYHDVTRFYTVLFMSKATYTQYFEPKYLEIPFDIDVMNYGYATLTTPNQVGTETIIGRLPLSPKEIAVTSTYLKERMNLNNDDFSDYIGKTYSFYHSILVDTSSAKSTKTDFTLVGIIDDSDQPYLKYEMVLAETDFNFLKHHSWSNLVITVAVLGDNRTQNKRFIKELDWVNYRHDTIFSNALDRVYYFAEEMELPMYITGIIFTIFAAILISAFIASSIKYKQKDIGTLRALGAKGSDVGKIYVTEGLFITLLSALLASILTGIVINIFNRWLQSYTALVIDILYQNYQVYVLIFMISILVVLVSSLVPIKQLSRKKPIEVIRQA